MGSQRFRAVIAAGPRDSAVITMPFDPDEAWGAKADHPVSGTIGGCRVRTRLVPAGSGMVLTLAPKRLLSMGIAIGDDVTVAARKVRSAAISPRRSRPTGGRQGQSGLSAGLPGLPGASERKKAVNLLRYARLGHETKPGTLARVDR